jgi:hypothetical protein
MWKTYKLIFEWVILLQLQYVHVNHYNHILKKELIVGTRQKSLGIQA